MITNAVRIAAVCQKRQTICRISPTLNREWTEPIQEAILARSIGIVLLLIAYAAFNL